MRRLAFDYWDAFNDYDVDLVLSYLEEGYRAERESVVREDVARLKAARLLRIKLKVSERTPPQITGPANAEMFLTMKEPLGTRVIRMGFVSVNGHWRIDHAEEVE